MSDDTMGRSREWLQSCVNAATRSGAPEEADLEAFLLAHIDGEPARTQATVERETATLRARVVELEAELAAAHERLDEFGMRRDGSRATVLEGIDAMRTRIDEYRAWAHRGEMATTDLREALGLAHLVVSETTEDENGEMPNHPRGALLTLLDAARALLAKYPVKP